MPNPVTHQQMKDYTKEQFEIYRKLDEAHREAMEQRMNEGSKKMAEHGETLYGNGTDGLVLLVDRLWQGRWWVTALAVAVVGKILADVFVK